MLGFAGWVTPGELSAARVVPQSCTVFLISDGETVLGGGNEDQAAFPTRAWFLPPKDGKHGRFYIGFEGVVESGMNDQGLFYDSLAAPAVSVDAEEGKPLHHGAWTLRALETCATVDEVVAFLDGISVPGEWTDQLFFGDRNGDSIVVEAKSVLRRDRHYQLCTNFLRSRVSSDAIPCDRYLTVERMLDEMETVTLDSVRDVFSTVAASSPDGSGTAYTVVYDPRDLGVICYLWRDFEHPLAFDLKAELAGSGHVVELDDLAEPNPGRDLWVAPARRELDRLIEERIDRTIALGDRAPDLVGHYAVDPAVGVVPFPPVMIRELSVAWRDGLPHLVAAPERLGFDLRPAGDDVWFHTNVTAKPEMDLVLHRNVRGEVERATLRLIGLGDVPLVKVSDTPVYEPLP